VCGIAGKIDARGPVDEALLARMCSVIEHRGPDSRGAHAEEGVGLAMQRLSIIDLATGDQPIYNEDRSVVVVHNGEIYNYKELREGLRERGHTLATHSDTEVIVHLYEEHGERCVEHLRGMFAFALWDRRERRLLVARDRVGKKPLFYRATPEAFWFASEPKSILQDPEVPREVNRDAIDSYLQLQYVPHPLSAFAGLSKLPPAHTLVWRAGQQPKLRRYWKLSYRDTSAGASPAELEEQVRDGLIEATRLRLRSDVPLGAFLSGGVDSSAVVAAMAKAGSGQVKTYSIGFDVEAYDETSYAREVAKRYDTEHHEFRVEPSAMEILAKLVWHYGEPFADSSAIPSFYLAELTRRHVTVALNGDGGDESFAGYQRYASQHVSARLQRIPEPLRRAGGRMMERVGPGRQHRDVRSKAYRVATALAMDEWGRYAMWMSYFRRAEADRLYTREFAASLPADRTAPGVIGAAWRDNDADNLTERMLATDVETYLPGDLLVKMDIATMAHSLEVRSPFLDHVFMESVAGMPATAKLAGRTTKHLLKEAVRPWLPGDVIDRPKMGFGVPLAEWFRGPLRDLPAEILLDPRSTERGWFEPAEVRRLIDTHVSGQFDNAYKLWALLQLELWLRTYVDSPAPAPLSLALA
jgi:asparagine synthase (glutamine-hydrolysing)